MSQSYSSSSNWSHRYVIISAFITVFIIIFFMYTKFTSKAGYKYNRFLQPKSKCDLYCSENYQISKEKCHWYFLNYTPSSWESMWYNNIKTFQGNVCERLSDANNVNKTILAMQRLIDLQKFGRKKTDDRKDKNDELLSKMFYRQRCIDSRTGAFSDVAEVSQLIEPLIGLLRDPLTVCSPLPASIVPPSLYDGAILLSRRNLLLSVSAPYYISSLMQEHQTTSTTDFMLNNFNGNLPLWMYKRSKINQSNVKVETGDRKNILFDLGSGSFGPPDADISDTSTRWFYEYYKRFGLQFDRIIAFEAASIDPNIAWKQSPEDIFPIYTLINTGCTVNGTTNPWVTLQRIAKAHDYVVVKIDIDSFDIENILVNQVLNDSNIHSLIDELFFEHHVSVKEMLAYWRPPPGTLEDSYILFTKLRQLGIRMHSWP